MDLPTIILGFVGGTGFTKALDFLISLRKGRQEARLTEAQIKRISEQAAKENYDNWQEDREFYRAEFNKMQKEIIELYSQIAELRKILVSNNIPLPR